MCDLWKYTHVEATRPGAIPAQIQYVLEQVDLQESEELWVKLYNASNFFAEKNVPEVDLNAIADLLTPFNRVIVENHPLLTNDRLFAFAERLSGKLEVAMGLETVHPIILQRLNKQMTLDDFSAACERLLRQNIDVRSFVLLRPPGLGEQEGIDWCQRAVEFAKQSGARDVAVIPLRSGNGALEYLKSLELCELPLAGSLERVLAKCVGRDQTIVTADLWDWDKLRGLCPRCSQSRKQRLHEMNLQQCVMPAVDIDCTCCPAH
jgi:radical SAM enzyme (TIGR01210 family)